jgi:hypothetical protein
VRDDYRRMIEEKKVREKDFDIDGFLNVLEPFYRGGDYDFLLNSDKELDLTNKRFIVFELDNISRNKVLLPVVTLIIMETFIAKMRRLKGIRKMILIEECWKALMSRELTTKYPQIHDYSTIWMDTITHVTRRGSEEFGLANTNKLIRQYQYATGLKTGSTSLAKYCVSATAVKDGMELIAVVMAAPDFKIRFADAATLLNYGFSKCRIYSDENTDTLAALPLKKGISDEVSLCYRSPFQYVVTDGSDLSGITKELELPESVEAPVASGDVIGRAVYKLGDRELGTVDILCSEDIAAAVYKDYFMESLQMYLP